MRPANTTPLSEIAADVIIHSRSSWEPNSA